MTLTEKDLREIKKTLSEISEKLEQVLTWKNETDNALKGMDSHGILGYRQRIDLNYKRAKETEKDIADFKDRTAEEFSSINGKIQRIVGFAVGVGAVGGTIATIIIQILLKVLET